MGLTCTFTGTIVGANGTVLAGVPVEFLLCGPGGTYYTSSHNLVERGLITAVSNGSGVISQVVARNDELTPALTFWRVECKAAGLKKFIYSNGDTIDIIAATDLGASSQIFAGLGDTPDAIWLSHDHAQTLTETQKLQGITNLGITSSTTLALGVGSINLGHATANTLTASSGVLSIEGKTVLDQTNTLAGITNKTFVAPVLGAATATSINGAAFNTGTSTGSKYISFGGGQSYINLEGNNADYGYINTSGGYGGYISTAGSGNDSGGGGYINTAGNGTARGGNIDTRPNGATAGGNINTSYGGSINTSNGGGYIDTSNSGGSIYTSGGGGAISTAGTGSIELGAIGTRTTFNGTAATARYIDLPDASGTVLLDSNTATITNKSIAATQLTGNVAIARIATALTTPGAIGGTTPSTGAFTTISGTSTLTLGVVSNTAGTIVLRNASNVYTTTIVPSVVTANRQLNLPLITGTDTVAVLGLAQTFSGNKTFSGTVSCTSTLGVSGATTCSSTLAVTGATTLSGGLNLAPQYGALLTTTSGLTDYQGSATLTLGSNGPSVYGPGPIAWFSFNDASLGPVYFPVWGAPP